MYLGRTDRLEKLGHFMKWQIEVLTKNETQVRVFERKKNRIYNEFGGKIRIVRDKSHNGNMLLHGSCPLFPKRLPLSRPRDWNEKHVITYKF